MRNIDIFHSLHKPHTSRIVEGFDSVNSGSCSIGIIKGQYRQINAIVTECATDADQWRIVNLKGQINQVPAFDSVAVLGAVDDDQASALAQLQFGRMFDAIEDDVIETNVHGLLRYLATPHFHKHSQLIRRHHLTALQDVPCAVVPGWDGIELTTHEGKTANLLLDMQRHDDQSGLLSSFDGLAQLLESIGAEYADFDSIIVEYQYLDKLMNMLHKAMQTASKGGVKVLKVDQSDKPFRHKKVLNVAVSYDFEDGQTITILFHHPDRDAKRIAPQDTLLSWKILMNNRDVTGVIQPNQGEGIALPVLAGRVVKLINQNSARFKRTQVKKAASAQALADAEQRIAEKQNQKSALEAEIQGLLDQVDELAQQKWKAGIKALQPYLDKIVSLVGLKSPQVGNNAFSKTVTVNDKDYSLFASPYNGDEGGINISLSILEHGDNGEEKVEERIFTLAELQNGAMVEAEEYALMLDKKFKEFAGISDANEVVDAKERDEALFAQGFAGVARALKDKFDWSYSMIVNGVEKTFTGVNPDAENGINPNGDFTVSIVRHDNFIVVQHGADTTIKSELLPQYGTTAQTEENYQAIAKKLNDAVEKWVFDQKAITAQSTAVDKLINAVTKRRGEVPVNKWLEISTISEQDAEKVLSIYDDEFDFGVAVGGMVSSMIPFNLELLEKEDSSLFSYFNAKPDMVKSLSQSAFDILCQAKNNESEKTALYAYTVLRYSNKKTEFDYIHDLGFMKNKFRIASQEIGGKLYKMAMQYLNQSTSESNEDFSLNNEPDDTGNEASTDDADYLNKVIKGEVDFSNSLEVETQLEAIGGRLAPEINDLFEQAVTAYSVYQVDQAKLIN